MSDPRRHNSDVLIIMADSETIESLSLAFGEIGHHTATEDSGKSGLQRALTGHWRLIVVDLDLSDMVGFDVCRELRLDRRTRTTPLVIVSARREETDIVAALELGADDYFVKPVNHKVFISKVRSLLRQMAVTPHRPADVVEIQGLAIHSGRHEVRIGSRRIGLTVTEFELLHLLARNPGQVFRREDILKRLRSTKPRISKRAVDVQIVGLRRRLGAYGNRIETVRGVGYRLRAH